MNCFAADSSLLSTLASAYTTLTHLTLDQLLIYPAAEASLATLAPGLPALQELIIHSCEPGKLCKAPELCQRITSLRLSYATSNSRRAQLEVHEWGGYI